MPKISIVTVNLNNSEGLERTIKSVVEQNYTDLEFIVIDGLSKDGSVDILERYKDQIGNWCSEPDSGIYNAMNKGVAKATGDYILFLNSGDHFYTSTSLKDACTQFSTEDLVSFDIKVTGLGQNHIKAHPETLQFSYLFNYTLAHQSTFIKRSLFEKIGPYDESLQITADWKFFIDAAVSQKCSYKSVHQTLCVYHLDGISATADGTFKRRDERKHVLKTDYSLFYSDYVELKKLESNRFKILNELENHKPAQKINSAVLRFLLKIFSKKKLKDL